MNLPWKIESTEQLDLSLPVDQVYRNILQALLQNRGIDNYDDFINGVQIDYVFVKNVSGHIGQSIDQAVELIESSINSNKSIIIHGDYDVDGVSATAILWEALYYDLNYKLVFPFIPHRVNHGYGLSRSSVDTMVSDLAVKGLQPGLLITVDCGITAKDSVTYAQEKGFTVIVTDHHTLPDDLNDVPKASAVVHTYDLCGAGISWVISSNLRMKRDIPLQGVDLVALATLSDVQPLTGYNRNLVKSGLTDLSTHKRMGLRALCQLSGIPGKQIGTYEVGWVIGPRLNATGRLDHALDALRLLVVKNLDQADTLAQKLQDLNLKRQELTEVATQQAYEMVESRWNGNSPIIVFHPDWHEGVIGLIASRLVGKFKKPAIVMAPNGDEGVKGSARSIPGINVVEILRSASELMTTVGGHEMAAGFSLSKDNLGSLLQFIDSINLNEMFDVLEYSDSAEMILNPELISWDLFQCLEQLNPHGVSNPQPQFVSVGLELTDVRTVGKNNDHLKVILKNNLNGIGFGLGSLASSLKSTPQVDILFSIDKDDFRGGKSIQLKLKDIQSSEC
ncbi:single-stranded-DNA-specific exonuclease RecJ [candidate division WWE3 bacterium]|nr:single-stranded-DNA-specific exonuclease RecJ [candidate division WWE3 bacterium]